MSRSGDTSALARRMRGTGGLPGLEQILDRAGFEAFGWSWLDFERSVLAEQVARKLPALGSGADSQQSTQTVPEYRLTSVGRERG